MRNAEVAVNRFVAGVSSVEASVARKRGGKEIRDLF
jgi:hypothetical protein